MINNQLLVVGIQKNQGIIDMLEQEGVPYIVFNSVTDIIRQKVRVIIWEEFSGELVSYINDSNNALITNMSTLAKIENRKQKRVNIVSYHAPTGCKLVEGVSGMLINDRLTCIGEPAIGYAKDRKGNTIDDCGIIYRKGGRNIIAYPWDIFQVQKRKDWEYRPFFSPTMKKEPIIEVGLTWDRGAVRRILFNSIQELFSLLSLPMVRLCPRPNKKGNYVIRIDVDGFSQESTDKVLNLSKECGFPFTWFINVQGHGSNIEVVNKLMNCGQDVQLHCYRHIIYPDYFRNKRNIEKGKEILARYKVAVKSVAGPTGQYSQNFQKAVEANGLSYSSEFGFGVDDLPRWTKPNHKGALQVPAHAPSIGVMQSALFSKNEIFEHWKRVLKRTIDMGYVCILYDHPLNRLENYLAEFREMHDYCVSHAWTPITMTEYADWWIMRTNIEFMPRMTQDDIMIDSKSELNKVLFEVYPNRQRIKSVIGAHRYFMADESSELEPLYVWGEVTERARTEQRIREQKYRRTRLEFRLFPWIYTPISPRLSNISILRGIAKRLRRVLR